AGRSRWILSNGRGAVVGGPLFDEEFLVIPEIDGGAADGRVFLAAPVSKEDLHAGDIAETVSAEFDGWTLTARSTAFFGEIVLSEKKIPLPSEEDIAAAVLEKIRREGLACLPWNDSSRSFLARCRFVSRMRKDGWPGFSDEALLADCGQWLIPFVRDENPVIDEDALQKGLSLRLGWENERSLAQLAPLSLSLPSGSSRAIDYESGDIPVLAARLQEFFGCSETPKICGVDIMLHLLSPAGRPVQITRDLGGFWDRAYPEVKKELMGRYPRHYWPENPREAEPTARAKPRK
ncbi:MAG: ATP-dependent helicase C-terminal domain-containing protein, partial [Spirochaetota bacterium]